MTTNQNPSIMPSPAVSVVIPTYNRAYVLARAVDSVLAQTFQDFELLIVDDGSTDSTAALARRYVDLAPDKVRYLTQPHFNVASARNRGVRHARGELLAFLDSDDQWHPEKLQRQIGFLERSGVALVHTGRTLTRTPGNRRDRIRSFPQRLARSSRELLSASANVAMTVMVRRAALDRVGLFDEMLNTTQDLDLWLRIAREFDIGVIDAPLVHSFKLEDSHMAANPVQTYHDRIRVMHRMARDRHEAVNRPGWYRLMALHCASQSAEHCRRRRYAGGLYWALRAIHGFAFAAFGTPRSTRRRLSLPAIWRALRSTA
ncbi:MAG: glycosyltransferase family 2 protein [Chromatiales bacterium]|nr:glycosyltransferase family 2 protein [Chromatiales bacterium]